MTELWTESQITFLKHKVDEIEICYNMSSEFSFQLCLESSPVAVFQIKGKLIKGTATLSETPVEMLQRNMIWGIWFVF